MLKYLHGRLNIATEVKMIPPRPLGTVTAMPPWRHTRIARGVTITHPRPPRISDERRLVQALTREPSEYLMLETNEHEDEQGGQQTGEKVQARWGIDLGWDEVYRGHAVGFRVCVLTTDLGSRFINL